VELINPLTALDVYIRPKTMVASAIAPRTVKILKNRLCVFDRGENLLQNGVQYFAIRLSQSPSNRVLKLKLT